MENKINSLIQELVFSSGDSSKSKQIHQLVRSGQLIKIAPRIYTSNQKDPPEEIIRRNIFSIIGVLYPGSLLSHRSAIEFQPTSEGHLFLTYLYTKNIKLPGITIHFFEGKGPIEGDLKVSGDLYASQLERVFLENLQTSRNSGEESKTIDKEKLEERLEKLILHRGEEGLNAFRDKACSISKLLNLEKEFQKLDKIIGALLSSRKSSVLSSPSAISRSLGMPYDSARISLFEKLFAALMQEEYPNYTDKNTSPEAFRNFAFFEAYFSNFIEGTEFEVIDARKIIETNIPMPSRDEDSHDILGTYKIANNINEMSVTPDNPEDFISLLKERHKTLLSARLLKSPGNFKEINNRAGNTNFVDHTLVRGTLKKAFDFYKALYNPFARAAYMMFIISEIHPFIDGNGRIARIMMNAELVKANHCRIIIPTVYREDYLGALRKLTRNAEPKPYIKMLQYAQYFSSTLIANNIDDMEKQLELSNAFKMYDEAKLKIIE